MRVSGYEYAEGARFQPGAKVDPNTVGNHLEMLREQCHGEITPKDIVDDARNDNSPLHPFFEWSDSKAAEQYRLQQARGLIRSVVAIYVSDKNPAVRTRAYVHIPEGETSHYRETGHAMALPQTRDVVLRKAWSELQAWRKRYRDLKEFSQLFAIVDKTKITLPKTGSD